MRQAKVDVVFIHPEGNFWNNPQLSAIIEILLERGHSVGVVAKKAPILQDPFSDAMRVVLVEKRALRFVLWPRISRWGWLFFRDVRRARRMVQNAKQVVAIDADGAALAAFALSTNARKGFISYELFYEDEIGELAKRREIEAMRHFKWFVAADPLRADELSRENQIPRVKIVCAPVAGRMQDVSTVLRLREQSQSEATRYVVHVGSTGSWTRLEEVIESVDSWPAGWKLLVHGRYGIDRRSEALLARSDRIEVSARPVKRNSDLASILARATVGLALYRETHGPYAGQNIRHVGLASGKATTYLRFGCMVFTSDSRTLGEVLKAERLGHPGVTVPQIPDLLGRLSWDLADSERAVRAYNKHLATGRPGCELSERIVRELEDARP